MWEDHAKLRKAIRKFMKTFILCILVSVLYDIIFNRGDFIMNLGKDVFVSFVIGAVSIFINQEKS